MERGGGKEKGEQGGVKKGQERGQEGGGGRGRGKCLDLTGTSRKAETYVTAKPRKREGAKQVLEILSH